MELDDEKNNVANVLTNICRCCLSRGCYKDISTEYFWLGQSEIYEKMLKETFNICMTYHEDGDLNTGYRLICDECIQKLREANTFRNLVLQSESKFLKQLEVFKKQFSDTAVVIEKDEKGIKQDDDEHMENDFGGDDLLLDIKVEPKEDDDSDYDITLDTLKKKEAKRKGGLKRKAKRKKERTGVRKRDASTSKGPKAVLKYESAVYYKEEEPEKKYLKENTLNLILNSNVCFFRHNRTRLKCFICDDTFIVMEDLREHTRERHSERELCVKVKNLKMVNLKKIDISNLACKICEQSLDSLDSLKRHLIDVHGIFFHDTSKDIIVPYRLCGTKMSTFNCDICRLAFKAFNKLVIHMNVHYQNNVCDACGAGFPNLSGLQNHKRNLHRTIKCKLCDEVFTSSSKMQRHRIKEHKIVPRRKCPICEATFRYSEQLYLHKIEAHGFERTQFKCNYCEKTFLIEYLLKSHIKAAHFRQKKHQCVKCNSSFYSNYELTRHLNTTHVAEKVVSCAFCNAKYKCVSSLRRHMKTAVHKHHTLNGCLPLP